MEPDKQLEGLAGLEASEALARILSAVHGETGTIHALRDDGLLHLEAHAGGIPAPLLPVIGKIPVGKGMAGLAAQRAEPVQICNLQTDSSGDARPDARATGMRGSICVPMKCGDRVVGVLGVAVAREREYTAAEVAWLSRAGSVLAKALLPL